MCGDALIFQVLFYRINSVGVLFVLSAGCEKIK